MKTFHTIDDVVIDVRRFPSPVIEGEGVFKYEYKTNGNTLTNVVYTNGENIHREDGPAVISTDNNGGIREYWVKNGKLHRNGGPALYKVYGPNHDIRIAYYKNGITHNEDGPAVTDTYKNYICYTINGKHHSNGVEPSVQRLDNGLITKSWHKDGLLHKNDGPAYMIDYVSGGNKLKKWYLNGVCVDSQYGIFLKKEKKKDSNEMFKEFSAWYFFNKLLK